MNKLGVGRGENQRGQVVEGRTEGESTGKDDWNWQGHLEGDVEI